MVSATYTMNYLMIFGAILTIRLTYCSHWDRHFFPSVAAVAASPPMALIYRKRRQFRQTALVIATANVSVDMLAGLAIFPIVFAYGLEPAAGPGLLFETLPVAFGRMPGGLIIGTLFFVLVLFAALSTSICVVGSVVARVVERPGASRPMMAAVAGGVAWVIGLGSVFSHNIWSDFTPLSFISVLSDATIFRIIDFFVVNNLVLISTFFIAIFVGWTMSERATCDELGLGNGPVYRSWRFVMRYLVPVAIVIISLISFI